MFSRLYTEYGLEKETHYIDRYYYEGMMQTWLFLMERTSQLPQFYLTLISGIVLETFEEAMTKNAQGSFDCAPADVAELRRYGIYYLNNLFYTPETKQQAENLEQMLRRARSPKVIEMLFRGLESYLGFIKRNSSAP